MARSCLFRVFPISLFCQLRSALIGSHFPVSRALSSSNYTSVFPFCFLRIAFLFLFWLDLLLTIERTHLLTTPFHYVQDATKNVEDDAENVADDTGNDVQATVTEDAEDAVNGTKDAADDAAGDVEDDADDAMGDVEDDADDAVDDADDIAEEVDDLPVLSVLKGLEVGEGGKIFGADGKQKGQLDERDPEDMIGKTIGDDGELLDEDGDVIGRASVFPDKAKEVADQRAEDLPEVGVFNGLEVGEHGNILGSDGTPLSKIVEGAPKDLIGLKLNDKGEIVDEDGDVIGRAEVVPGEALRSLRMWPTT